MILKIGFSGKWSTSPCRYFDNISDLMITGWKEKHYFYDFEEKCLYFSESSFNDDDRIKIDTPEMLFNIQEKSSGCYVTFIRYTDTQTGVVKDFIARAETVFLMNDNGKTVDRY